MSVTGPFVWDARSARAIPGVSRALQLFGGMTKQMPMDAYRGIEPLPRPRLLSRPDPLNARSWFVQCSIEDYLLNGNAVAYVTARGVDGWPTAVVWLPVNLVAVTWQPPNPFGTYWYNGVELDPYNVVHVKRGADRGMGGVRGIGIVEEALRTLDRVAMEEAYEYSTLTSSAVPSVAIITPQATLNQDTADEAKANWLTKFAGPTREPAILPAGTTVTPLSWSPTDTQLIEARKLSLTDIASVFNLDGYWLGAPVAGLTYKSPAQQYQQILRTSLEPVLADFEDVWSDAWLPRGQQVRFDRNQLLRDDLPTTTTALVALVGAGIMSVPEAREYLASGSVNMPASRIPKPPTPAVEPAPPAPVPEEQAA